MGSVLSLVVPIYNVAPYLHDCLISIANQGHRELEVILVDDGSTDSSPEIAAEWAARDSRFRLVGQPNQGLGAARNTGVDHASGDYLMFVDSDDVLPSYATELLVSAVEQTGSDFAAGNAFRLNRKGVRPSPLHRGPFARTELRTHVSRRPELLSDRTAWNKVFRRQFWDSRELRFPEGVLYEDTPVIVPAHVLATSVDIVEAPVYYWREREDGDRSITQRRTELKGFVDRISGVDWVSRFLADNNQAKVKRWYDASVLSGDLTLFMKVLPETDEEYQQTFLDRCNDFLDRVDDRALDGLHTNLRLQWHMVRQRMLPELITVILALRNETNIPIVRHGFKRYHDLPFMKDNRPDLPRELYRAGTPRPATAVHEARLAGDKLHLRGHAYVQGSRATVPFDAVRMLWLTGPAGRRSIPVVAQPARCPDATVKSNLANCSYEWSGFSAALSLRALRDANGGWIEGDWNVAVGVVTRGRGSRGLVKAGVDGRLISLPAAYPDERTRITPVLINGALVVRVERVYARATAVRFTDDALEITGELPGGHAAASAPARAIQLSRVPGVVWQTYPVELSGSRFTARIPLADLPAAQPPLVVGEVGDRWLVDLVIGSDPVTVRPIAVERAFVDARHGLGHRQVRVQPTEDGRLQLAVLPAGPVVTGVQWNADHNLELAGDLPADTAGSFADLELVLRVWGRREQRVFPAEVTGQQWRAVVNPLAVPSYAGHIELRTGQWDLLCRRGAGGRASGAEVDSSPEGMVEHLPFAAEVLERLPVHGTAAHRQLVLRRSREERAVLTVGPDLDLDEQGVYGQSRLRTRVYPAARRQPLRDAVLYNSFTGRQYSDSPRAIHQELVARGLPLEHRWVVMDGQVALPDGAQPLRLNGREWYEAYATSRYIVTNQHLPQWFRRREGQVVVQTWHGTPLKRIGHDITEVRFADPGYLEKLAVETPNWSLLLSPNRFSTPIMRRAFRYEGEILESGYPRNDVLHKGRDEMAAQVRATLGLPAGKRVVLYAPTWRDDEYYGPGRYKLSLLLDLDRAAELLGEDHVLLVRRHPNVADEIPQAGGGFVWDVSTYPDMADLLATTDILVTDYSSVMFDFANTGRPMLFFTYDLEHYRDRLRGFYFDFEAEAPGPLLGTSDEVIKAIRDVDTVAGQYRDAYQAFAQRACDLDDGSATVRAVDRMLSI
jgi:CDP-glycerol glycerophosphotransferase